MRWRDARSRREWSAYTWGFAGRTITPHPSLGATRSVRWDWAAEGWWGAGALERGHTIRRRRDGDSVDVGSLRVILSKGRGQETALGGQLCSDGENDRTRTSGSWHCLTAFASVELRMLKEEMVKWSGINTDEQAYLI